MPNSPEFTYLHQYSSQTQCQEIFISCRGCLTLLTEHALSTFPENYFTKDGFASFSSWIFRNWAFKAVFVWFLIRSTEMTDEFCVCVPSVLAKFPRTANFFPHPLMISLLFDKVSGILQVTPMVRRRHFLTTEAHLFGHNQTTQPNKHGIFMFQQFNTRFNGHFCRG